MCTAGGSSSGITSKIQLTLQSRFLPAARSGTTLLTTRNAALGTLAQEIDLAPLEREERILFPLRRAKLLPAETGEEEIFQFARSLPEQYAVAEELVTAMGRLPLALDQAGAYSERPAAVFLPIYNPISSTRSACWIGAGTWVDTILTR